MSLEATALVKHYGDTVALCGLCLIFAKCFLSFSKSNPCALFLSVYFS